MESIKDFTHIDLKHLESISLPVSSCQERQENVVFEFLDADSHASLVKFFNVLDRIDIDAFRNLNKLVTLELSCNRLDKLEEVLFSDLNGLEKLNLDGNRQFRIKSGLFIGKNSFF